MLNIEYKDRESMVNDTQSCFLEIEGIEKITKLQNELFNIKVDFVCFGDAQIDGLEYPPSHDRLTVFVAYCFDHKNCRNAHYVIDFYNPELYYFDIEFNTHWIDEVIIQKNSDGKYSISFGTGECDFRYSHAKVNRCWVDR